jgi:hypothetical protein
MRSTKTCIMEQDSALACALATFNLRDTALGYDTALGCQDDHEGAGSKQSLRSVLLTYLRFLSESSQIRCATHLVWKLTS